MHDVFDRKAYGAELSQWGGSVFPFRFSGTVPDPLGSRRITSAFSLPRPRSDSGGEDVVEGPNKTAKLFFPRSLASAICRLPARTAPSPVRFAS